MRAGMAFGEKGRILRFDCDDLNGRFLFFKVLADAGDGAACTDTGQEDVDSAVCIFIDFRTRRQAMNFRIDGVRELAGNEGVGNFFGQFVGFVNGTLHARFPRSQDDFSTISGDEVAAFDGHRFRHGEDGTIAFCGGDGSQTDTGIAAGRFDDDRTLLQEPLLFGVFDHGLGDTVFGRTGRVKGVEFNEQIGGNAGGAVVAFRFQ